VRDLRWMLIAVAVVAALVGLLLVEQPAALALERDSPRLVYLLLAVVLMGGGTVAFIRSQPATALRYAAIWFLIALVICAGYVLRDDFSLIGRRLTAELLPHRGVEQAGTVQFKSQERGHFVIEARVDGVAVRFLLDTGATDVVLAPADARRLGFDTAALSYSRSYRTANGTVQGAPVRLGLVEVGPIQLRDVRASVNAAAMDRSLLGMSFLSRLSGFDVTGETLTLRP
jgi:aspartyl protease family protein